VIVGGAICSLRSSPTKSVADDRDVSLREYRVLDRFPDREEAGTPNIVGALLLAAALETLLQVGMAEIQRHEQTLFARCSTGLPAGGVRVYAT